MKRICLFALVIALILPVFSGCARQQYSDSVSCQDLGNATKSILEEQKNGEYTLFDEMHIKYNFDNTSLYTDYFIFYSTEVEDIDELGIFHTSNKERARELSSLAEKYISDMQKNQRAFIESYAPEETSKLDDARVYLIGNYVVYTILSSEDRNDCINKIESMLKNKKT